MIDITIPNTEVYDEKTNRCFDIPGATIRLEHSLVSISKWESKWKRPFLESQEKSVEETIDYIRCMTITQNVNPLLFYNIPTSELEKVQAYILDTMSATTFREDMHPKSREVITSELIYYWMIAENIPMECQKWHINRLLTLIKICGIKNSPGKKMGKNEILNSNRALNDARRKAMHSKG